MRREHLVALIVLAWSGHAHASDEDVAIERASNDLKCDDLRMMHAKNQYAFVGCGKKRLYECESGKCDDVTNRKRPDPKMPNAGCVVAVSADVVMLGCFCLSAMSKSGPGPIGPGVPTDMCR
jgi:hypothetical protein